ncbi:hypothetical protein ACFY2Z_40990 [Streptomyces sp. NPDC001222]|uniref:hypothetical protein n=1 Tax=Streptomyces sp. NPDC001222 TaxID=3364548 RepID=UPI00369BFC05
MSTEQRAAVAPVVLRQIGIGEDGSPLYAYADRTPVVQPAPVPASRPIGAYVAAGIGGAVALSFLAMAAALLAVAVAVGAVSVTICILVLRGMWREMQSGQKH